jgi:hypothetical protein
MLFHLFSSKGLAVRAAEGDVDGLAEGDTVGEPEGTAEGEIDGATEGMTDRAAEGLDVGAAEGDTGGLAEGDTTVEKSVRIVLALRVVWFRIYGLICSQRVVRKMDILATMHTLSRAIYARVAKGPGGVQSKEGSSVVGQPVAWNMLKWQSPYPRKEVHFPKHEGFDWRHSQIWTFLQCQRPSRRLIQRYLGWR